MPVSTVANPNHHLWRNGRLWWIAFTVVYDGWRQERVRRSLGTADLEEARHRRDDVLRQYATPPNADVVAFRQRGDATAPFHVAAHRTRRPEADAFGLRPSSFALDPESTGV
jgi:hypothetical protein